MAMEGNIPPEPVMAPRYGEQTLANYEAERAMPPAPPPSPSAAAGDMPPAQPLPEERPPSQWGRTLKGIAKVTAVALVAVVALSFAAAAFPATFAGLFGTPIIGPALVHAAAAGTWIVNVGAWCAGASVHAVVGAFAWIGHGITGLFGHAGVSTTTAAVTGGVAVGAGVTTIPLANKAMAVHATSPAMTHVTGADDGSVVQAHSASTTAKISHHAGDHHHNAHGAAWLQRVTSHSAFKQTLASGSSYQNAVMASQAAGGGIQPRNSAFSEQVNTDRAALEASLGEPKR